MVFFLGGGGGEDGSFLHNIFLVLCILMCSFSNILVFSQNS